MLEIQNFSKAPQLVFLKLHPYFGVDIIIVICIHTFMNTEVYDSFLKKLYKMVL